MSLKPHPGFYGWHLLIALWVIYITITGFTFYGVPVLFPYMIEELGWNRTQISSGMMVILLSMGLATPLCSWCLNRFGQRAVIVFGGCLGAMGMLMMQFTDSVLEYILYFGVIGGCGIAFSANIPVQATVTHWFKRRRGLAFGLVLAGGSIGGFIAPIVLTWIINQSGGNWHIGWRALMVMMLIAAATSLIFVRNRPGDLQQFPDGISPEHTDDSTTQKHKVAAVYQSEIDWTLSDAIRTPQLWLLILAVIGGQFIWQVLLSQGPLHLADRGFSGAQYSLMYGATIGVSIIGRLGGGILVDRIEPKRVFLFSLAIAFMGSVLFWYAKPGNPLGFGYPLFSGVALGALTIATPTMIANYWGAGAFASVNGVIFPTMIIFNSSAPFLAGFLYDSFGSYLPILSLSWVLLGCGFIAMSFLSPPAQKIGVNT